MLSVLPKKNDTIALEITQKERTRLVMALQFYMEKMGEYYSVYDETFPRIDYATILAESKDLQHKIINAR